MKELLDFTSDEVKTIQECYDKGCEGLTPEEVRLLSDWETANALADAKHTEETEHAKELAALELKNSKSVADKAKRTIAAIEKAALARLEKAASND